MEKQFSLLQGVGIIVAATVGMLMFADSLAALLFMTLVGIGGIAAGVRHVTKHGGMIRQEVIIPEVRVLDVRTERPMKFVTEIQEQK